MMPICVYVFWVNYIILSRMCDDKMLKFLLNISRSYVV